MLVQFTVENFLSFAGETTFSMLATADDKHPGHLVANDTPGGKALLRGAAIYGANAAGKTNLVKALKFAQTLIIEGTRPGSRIPLRPFRMWDPLEVERPSRFQFIIRTSGVTYEYGFVLDASRIHQEWLFGTRDGKRQAELCYFERTPSGDSTTRMEFGRPLGGKNVRRKQRLDFIAEGTRPNQLFLTEAFERNVQEMEPLRVWFHKVLLVLRADQRLQALPALFHHSQEFRRFCGAFLAKVGTGISEVRVTQEPLDAKRHFPGAEDGFIEDLKESVAKADPDVNVIVESETGERRVLLANDAGVPVVLAMKMLHPSPSGPVEFEIKDESDGTQRLVQLLLPLLHEMQDTSERVVILDELDRRFHPLLSEVLVRAALECRPGHRSQFIFTTHDTNLLDLDLLRRDEIWFVEKDDRGASHPVSLAEFKVRSDLKIEKGYLNGRFGAVPFSGDPSRLGWLDACGVDEG